MKSTQELEPRELFYRQAMLSLVGPAAGRRAELGSSPGWRRFISDIDRTAYHEAAHAVFGATQLKYPVASLTIVPDLTAKVRHRRGFRGQCRFGKPATLWNRFRNWIGRLFRPEPELEHDERTALRLCILLCPEPVTWASARNYFRVLEHHATAFVDANWVPIAALAEQLQKHRTLDHYQVEQILEKPWAAVKPWVPPIESSRSLLVQ